MVERVWGECNGLSTEYELINGKWQASLPRNETGEWGVTVWAMDEAGNKSFIASMLYAVNPADTCVNVQVDEIEATNMQFAPYVARVNLPHISAEITKCELCGRW